MRRVACFVFPSLFAFLVACEKPAAPPSTEPTPGASPPAGSTVCTREAKICPDGSAVGRTGPNCEFAPCPDAAPSEPAPGPGAGDGGSTACTADAKMCPDGSAVGRTGPNCEFAPCPKK